MARMMRRRRQAGMGLIEAILGIVVFGVLISGGMRLLHEYVERGRVEATVVKVLEVRKATELFMLNDWTAALDLTAGGVASLPLTDLAQYGHLSPLFRNTTPFGGQIQVLLARAAPTPSNREVVRALITTRGGNPMTEGMIRHAATDPSATIGYFSALRGATSDLQGMGGGASMSQFDGSLPGAGHLGTVVHVAAPMAYGSALYRINMGAGKGYLNRMGVDLDMGGYNIVDADRVEGETLLTREDAEIGGNLLVEGDANVQGSVSVAQNLSIDQTLIVGNTLEVTNDISSTTMNVDRGTYADLLNVERLVASGSVVGDNVTAREVNATQSIQSPRIQANTVQAGALSATTADTTQLNTQNLTANGLNIGTSLSMPSFTADHGRIGNLYVNNCNGC